MDRRSDVNLYEQVAEQLRTQVQRGAYQAGDRVPSVRRLSGQLKVSIATVVEAYRRLEAEGVLEARPQSGYYVRASAWPAPAEPETCEPAGSPCEVSISELAMKVLRAAAQPDVVQLGVATPHPALLPQRALERILAALVRRGGERSLRYEFPPGSRELRTQLARRAAEIGCDLSPDEFVVTSGCQEALSLALRAVARPGDTVLIESPAFYGTLQTIESLGLKALELPTHPRDGVSLDALKLALEQWRVAACVLVPSFSNPLGACMPEDNRKRLVRLLAERDIPLVEDDIYGDLAFARERPRPAKAFDRKGLVLHCGSVSKTVAPGLRVGWVAPGRFQARLEHLKYVNTMATATLPQLAVAEFLAHGGYDRHLRRVRQVYARQTEQMRQAIVKYFPAGTRVTQPAGGFVLWVELPERVDALELYRRALARRITIAPGPLFSAMQRYRNFIRLNCALPWDERLEHALVTLGRLAGELG